jgi:eukaryotic-like serine/threonine-protein kinase
VSDEELQVPEEEPYRESMDSRGWDDLLEGALKPGDVIAGKYRADELVGWGAMGFVLRAWHEELHEPVAVKLLLPELAKNEEALTRFEREARFAFKIKSEHVTRVLDVGRLDSGQPYMVMEFLDGIELSELIYTAGGTAPQQLPVPEVVDYVMQACDALVEAHGLGIVHRDLKPDNLFLTKRSDGTSFVKLMDFGLSKRLSGRHSRAPRERAITGEEQVMGTAHYMSPEQWVAAKTVGPPADIWALGVIIYEAVTGVAPFLRNNYAAMCNAVLHEEPEPIDTLRPEAPAGLEAVLRRCLKKAPEDRYASVVALAADLLPFAPKGYRPPAGLERALAEERPRPPSVVPPAPSQSDLRPAGARPLGLVGPGGAVETWRDLQHERPPSSRSLAPVVFVFALIVLLVVAAIVVL